MLRIVFSRALFMIWSLELMRNTVQRVNANNTRIILERKATCLYNQSQNNWNSCFNFISVYGSGWDLKSDRMFVLSVFGHQSPSLASLPGHQVNHLIWVDSSLMALLELPLAMLTWSSLPYWLSKNHLIWVDSIPVVSLGLHAVCPLEFPLSLLYRTVSDYYIFCIYCILFHSVMIIPSFCTPMIWFCTVRSFCSTISAFRLNSVFFSLFSQILQFNACSVNFQFSSFIQLLFDYCSVFWSWKCIPGILILERSSNHHLVYILESINIKSSTRLAYFRLHWVAWRLIATIDVRWDIQNQFLWLGLRRTRQCCLHRQSMM